MLLIQVCTYECGAVDPELFTRSNIGELYLGCKGHYDPSDIEVISNHEVCLMFKKEVTLGLVAGDLMSMEDWMGVPVMVTVVILSKNNVTAILEARERHRQEKSKRSQERESEVRR